WKLIHRPYRQNQRRRFPRSDALAKHRENRPGEIFCNRLLIAANPHLQGRSTAQLLCLHSQIIRCLPTHSPLAPILIRPKSVVHSPYVATTDSTAHTHKHPHDKSQVSSSSLSHETLPRLRQNRRNQTRPTALGCGRHHDQPPARASFRQSLFEGHRRNRRVV